MSTEIIHVVMAGDRNVLWGIVVTGRSALEHASRPIGFNILGTGLTAEDRKNLERSWDHPNLAYLRFHTINKQDIAAFRSTAYLKSKAAYSRYFIGRIGDVSRLVYLDTDLLVLRDLAEAADYDLAGKGMGAVRDISARLQPKNPALRERLKLRDESNYFNSGFLIIDMDHWRNIEAERKLIDISVQRFDELDSQDQDALNILFEDDVALMDVSWNTSQYEADAEQAVPGSEKIILHLIGTIKPWHADYDYKFKSHFYHWFDRTAYRGRRPATKGGLADVFYRLNRKIPTADMIKGKFRRLVK